MRALSALLLAMALSLTVHAAERKTEAKILVQSSPLAGFRYHEGKRLWDELKIGDLLTLTREPDNPYDAKAIRVDWQGQKLGYVPRKENDAVARFMDNGQKLEARIVRLKVSRNPWQRIEFEIYLAE